MARKEEEEKQEGTAGWLTTFCDLTTLLLTFFVLLLTMSVIDENRKRVALNSLVGAFGLLHGGRSPLGSKKGLDVSEPTEPILETKPINMALLKEITVKNNLIPEIKPLKKDNKLMIKIAENVLFRPGTMEIQPKIQRYLSQLAGYLRKNFQEVEICGYTDRFELVDDPQWWLRSWELSTQRAMAVYRFFLEEGIAKERLSAHGFSYQDPRVDGMQYPHLRHRNARVEIILGYNETLPTGLPEEKPEPAPEFNYKDFIFKLFPFVKS